MRTRSTPLGITAQVFTLLVMLFVLLTLFPLISSLLAAKVLGRNPSVAGARQPLPHGRGSDSAPRRAATVRERLHPAGAHPWLRDVLLAALFGDVLSGYVRITAWAASRRAPRRNL
jgi:hypothetical protein